jgi:putative nucleotidyltransferase with HDIG domain
MSEDLDHKIDQYIADMPSLPTSVSKVLEVCNNPQTSPADLNRVVSLDPVLVGRVLKLLNSAYYGMGQRITSLVRAIIMLGINTVKNLALSAAILGSLHSVKKTHGIEMEGFWRHSLCVGVTAKLLAKKRGVDPKLTEEYFTAGLLHDIGKIPLNAVLADGYMSAVVEAERERIPLYQAEDKIMGLNHCNTGALIVKAWKLEGPVADVIMHHHHYSEYSGGHTDILYSVAAANYFAVENEIGFSGSRFSQKPEKNLWQQLNVDIDIFDDIEKTVNDEIEKAKVFLKIK